MAREHKPIQIGLPSEAAWRMDHAAPTCYVAFLEGDGLPDPGDAFIAAGEAFGVAPQAVKPLPIEDGDVAWAFECRIPGRGEPVVLWCERVDPPQLADLQCPEARWSILIESILEKGSPVDDAAMLAATVARAGGARTRALLSPDLGEIFAREEIARHFVTEVPGALLDERHLFRIEIEARDRTQGPYWLTTIGLHRIGCPELEMLEIEPSELPVALDLLDAIAARLVTEEVPGAGVPFEAGESIPVALVPVDEVIATLAPGAPGGREQRVRQPPGPRAVVCAAEKRGAFRAVWMPPREVLARIERGEAGILRSARVTDVEVRFAQAEWPRFLASFAARRAHPGRIHLAKVTRRCSGDVLEHSWIEVEDATGEHVRGRSLAGDRDAIDMPVAALGDWVVRGVEIPGAPAPIDVGPRTAWRLA